MSSYGLILDIEGCNVALATDERLQARHAASVLPILDPASIPSAMTMAHDPDTGQMDAGGMTLAVKGDLSGLLESQLDATTGEVGLLDGDLSKTATSIALVDASGFASSGKIWIGRECISYSGKSSNTLTGCTRATLSTRASAHDDGARVTNFNPTLLDRQVWVTWQNSYSPSTSTALSRYVGFLDRLQDDGAGGVSLTLVSGQPRLVDQAALSGRAWFKGRLARSIPATADQLKIALDAKDDGVPDYGGTRYDRCFLRIEEEIIECRAFVYPASQKTIASIAGDVLTLTGTIPAELEIGDQVDLTDSLGVVKATTTVIDYDLDTSEITVASVPDYTHASGDKLKMNYHTLVLAQNQTRGIEGGSLPKPHDAGEEVGEIRILEGDQVAEILLPCLFSVEGFGTEGPEAGAFDSLPEGWGLGVPSDFVDVDSFLELVAAGRTSARRYLRQEELPLADLLKWISITSNCAIFWSEAGTLTCQIREDLYPDSQATHTLSESHRKRGSSVSLDVGTDKIRNVATVGMDRGLDGEERSRLIVEVRDSSRLYGKKEIVIEDPGIRSAWAEVQLFGVLRSYLRPRSREVARLLYRARLQASVVYRPGQLVGLTLTNVLNFRGSRGFSSQTFEIVRVSPVDQDGYVELEIFEREIVANLGLIAPCALVEEIDGTTITLQNRSDSLFTDAAGRAGLVVPEKWNDGDEDVDWWLEGDLLRFWDVSSLGGTVQTADAQISSVSPNTSQIEVDAVPGWLTTGDLIRLQPWGDFQSSPTLSFRDGVYLALADNATETLDGDAPYLWGD